MISFLPQEKDGSVVFTAFDGDEALGSCEFTLSGYNMTFTRMDCGDDIITEGLARSAMGCAANRGGYIAKISSSLSSPAFERLGFAGGGSDFPGKDKAAAYGGGTATGVTITPMAFLVLQGSTARILPVDEPAGSSVERVISMIPELADRLTEAWKESKGKPAGNCGS